MYEEEKYSISYVKIVIKVIIVILIFLLAIKLVSMVLNNKTNVTEKSELSNQLKYMDDVARIYFKDELLPKESGDNHVVSIRKLIDENVSIEVKDNKGKLCNYDKSYIKIIKLDKQYQIKSKLVCGKAEDTYNTFIDIPGDENTSTTTTKKVTTTTSTTTKTTTANVTTKVSTTKENVTTTTKANVATTTKANVDTTTTTTKMKTTVKTTRAVRKRFTVSFNTNGGNIIDDQIVFENSTISNTVPYREGYSFIGWFYHGVKFDVQTKVKENIVLTAKWIKN